MNENEFIYGVQNTLSATVYNIATEKLFKVMEEMALLSAKDKGYKVIEYLGCEKPERSFELVELKDGDWDIRYYNLEENKGMVHLNHRMRVTK